MIWDWDLWAVMIVRDAAAAVFDDVAAWLSTMQYAVDDMMAELGARLAVPIDRLALDLRSILEGVNR